MKKAFLFLMSIAILLTGCSTEEMDASPAYESISVREDVVSFDSEAPLDAESDGSSAKVDVDGVKIALLDTGISTKAIDASHILPGYNYVTGTEDTEDQINHGTAVASVIVGCESAKVTGIAPEAYLIPLVIVTKQDGKAVSVSPEQLAQAIRDSIDIYQADIINVSLGIREDDPALREAIAYADKKGIPVISAVGNDGEGGRPYYPASYDTVLAVGSCDKNGEKSSFTQDGAQVLAPGEHIMLASRNGVPYGIRGTSFATGYISAYAAKILAEEPALTPEELYRKIIEEAGNFRTT